jgi:hypothetical protein
MFHGASVLTAERFSHFAEDFFKLSPLDIDLTFQDMVIIVDIITSPMWTCLFGRLSYYF